MLVTVLSASIALNDTMYTVRYAPHLDLQQHIVSNSFLKTNVYHIPEFVFTINIVFKVLLLHVTSTLLNQVFLEVI